MNDLVERFLIYSLKHQRAIKVMLMQDDKPQTLNLSVQSMDDDGFYYLSAKNKQQARYLRYDDVLAAAYKRGDSGEGSDIKENKG